MLNKKIEFAQGDARPIEVTITNADNTPVNLSDLGIRWLLAANRASEVVLVSKTVGDGLAIVDAAAGRLRIDIEPGDTNRLAGDYYHQLRITYPDGRVVTPVRDFLTISEAVNA